MGIFEVQICAQLENVTEVNLPPDEDWHFVVVFSSVNACFVQLECSHCREQSEEVYFNLLDEKEMVGSRGKATYVAKCKFCERVSSLNFVKGSISEYNAEDSEELRTIARFEGRGWNIVSFYPRGGFRCVSVNSETVFDNLDLNEGDWNEYDEKGECVVGIFNLKGHVK